MLNLNQTKPLDLTTTLLEIQTTTLNNIPGTYQQNPKHRQFYKATCVHKKNNLQGKKEEERVRRKTINLFREM